MNVTFFDPNQAHAPESLSAKITMHWQYFKLIVVVLTGVFAIVYLIMLNGLATQGFDMETLKAQQLSLHQEIEEIDISLAIPSSLYALESNELIQSLPNAEEKGFVEVFDSEYVFHQ